MCREVQCYYRDCGHTDMNALSPCYRERKSPGTCRMMERPERDDDDGVCEQCRGDELGQRDLRIRDLCNRLKKLEVGYHSRRDSDSYYQSSWQGIPRGGERQDLRHRASQLGSDADEWEMIERMPTKQHKGRNGSRDSWAGSRSSGRSGRSNGSERSGRYGRY